MLDNIIQWFRKQLKNKRGFSLVEMLIVLIVVSLLMAIIIPNVAGQRERIDAQAQSNMAEIIENQVETYRLVNGRTAEVTLQILLDEEYITDRQSEQASTLLGLDLSQPISIPIQVPSSDE